MADLVMILRLLVGILLGLQWDTSGFDAALAKARASGRQVLVDVYATWCGPCHEMDEKVWSRDDVQRALEPEFVSLRRDGEAGEGAELARRYHVVGYPTLLLIDAKTGQEVDRVMGFIGASELLPLLLRLRAGKGTLAELEQKVAIGDDAALRLEVATRHAMRGDGRAVAELEAVVRSDADNRAKRAAPALLTLGKYYYLRGLKDYAHAVEVLRELERRFPQTDEAGQAPYNLAIALHELKRDGEARAVLDQWLQSAPAAERGARYNAYAWLSYKNGFSRERGIEVAKQGLALDGKDHSLWDTLAELYALGGQLVEARDAEQHALTSKPKDIYYEAQWRRFGGKP
jgi:tetratricopeptide (TPR) repeat protein